jgi:hypothetical protein
MKNFKPDGLIEGPGYCDTDCKAAQWEDDLCKFRKVCPIGCGTVWVELNITCCKFKMSDCLFRSTSKCNSCTDKSNYEWDHSFNP